MTAYHRPVCSCVSSHRENIGGEERLSRSRGISTDTGFRNGENDIGGSTYALLHEDGELALIFDVDELLAAIGRVRNVQLEGKKWHVSILSSTGLERSRACE